VKEAITFSVSGKPQPAGSKRAFVLRGGANAGRAIITDANPKSKDWKVDIKHEAQRAYTGEPWDGPVELTLRFFVERPKSHYRSGMNADKLKDSAPAFPTSKPDVLKLARGVEDAITAIIWKDDAQIVTEKLTKRYGRPGVEIEIKEASI